MNMDFGPPQPKPYFDWYAYTARYPSGSFPSRRPAASTASTTSSHTLTSGEHAVPYTPSKGGSTHLDALTDSLSTQASQDPLDNFLTAKRTFVGKTVEDILGSLYERVSLKYENLQQLDYQACQLKTRLMALEQWRWGLNPQMERVRIGIEHEILDTDSEKRREEVECWRDVTRLKTELRESLREFSQEKQKNALITGDTASPWTYKNSAGH
jgi:hypothetical protein